MQKIEITANPTPSAIVIADSANPNPKAIVIADSGGNEVIVITYDGRCLVKGQEIDMDDDHAAAEALRTLVNGINLEIT